MPNSIDKGNFTLSYLNEEQVKLLSLHLENLSSNKMAGRQFSTSESQIAQTYIIKSLSQSGVLPFQGRFRHAFHHSEFLSQKQGNNIIGYIKGTQKSNQYIVLSAHFDHLGSKGSKIYNGADDNASGTAALLAFGQAIINAPLKHSVILLFTDGEEVNLLGAKAFIKQQQAFLPQIRLNINLDMIAGNKQTSKLHFIDDHLDQILSKNHMKEFMSLSASLPIKVKHGFKRNALWSNERIMWNNASDHAVFDRADIPFIYFGVGTHKNYHTTNDNFDNVNIEFYRQACDSIFNYLLFFDGKMNVI